MFHQKLVKLDEDAELLCIQRGLSNTVLADDVEAESGDLNSLKCILSRIKLLRGMFPSLNYVKLKCDYRCVNKTH